MRGRRGTRAAGPGAGRSPRPRPRPRWVGIQRVDEIHQVGRLEEDEAPGVEVVGQRAEGFGTEPDPRTQAVVGVGVEHA